MRALSAKLLLGGAIGALVAALVAWASGQPPAARLAAIIVAVAALGSAIGWWHHRRFHLPLERIHRRLEGQAQEGGERSANERDPRVVTELSDAVDKVTGRLAQQAMECESDRSHLVEILESMSDGVLVTDSERRIELVNPAFRTLFELQDDETKPMEAHLADLVGFIEDLDADGAVSRERFETETGAQLDLRGRRLSGRRSVVLAHDLTEQRRLITTIRDLVANVSHELRTPLTAIRGYAENLDDGALEQPEVAARFVGRILDQCRRLEALLEDLLALSRLERSEQFPAAELESLVDLPGLCESVVETVRVLGSEKQVAVVFEPCTVPAIAGSQEVLETMLLNLLENGIKYNRQGGEVTLGLSRGDGEVVVAVTDTGIGVPQQDLARIFERFYRVDRGRSRAEGGTGLGLAIVKHAAQLHGGRVEVESEIGRGSVFRVFLPAPG